eukprot:CAMPEP_0171799590 /NCGR_PEP_ID=MMETSP0991-20121206/71196_1 /TAXON_ID=483369 /ORGANISM="non described non described, Strain CCMP2098" /LENGTH=241 /DNA_ID=CAMNT_0012410981 /DNA_START=75 /DNA_END=797 /DNA_ORIENTATION=+
MAQVRNAACNFESNEGPFDVVQCGLKKGVGVACRGQATAIFLLGRVLSKSAQSRSSPSQPGHGPKEPSCSNEPSVGSKDENVHAASAAASALETQPRKLECVMKSPATTSLATPSPPPPLCVDLADVFSRHRQGGVGGSATRASIGLIICAVSHRMAFMSQPSCRAAGQAYCTPPQEEALRARPLLRHDGSWRPVFVVLKAALCVLPHEQVDAAAAAAAAGIAHRTVAFALGRAGKQVAEL